MKTRKKKIYYINIFDYFGDDYGELWLDENKKPIKFNKTDGVGFDFEYYSFIFDYSNLELIDINIYLDNADIDIRKKLREESNMNKVAKLLKKEIDYIKINYN